MQQPGYPPAPFAPPPPPKRSRRTRWIVVGVVAVVLVVCIAGIAAATKGGSNPGSTASSSTPGTSTAPTAGVTPTAAPATGDHKVGQTVNFNNHWQVTINSVTSYPGDPNQFDPTPAAGDTFLVIDATLKNLQSSAQPLSTLVDFELRDSQGNNDDESFLPSLNGPDGTIPAGGLAHGKWGYEVPTTAHTFTFVFSDDLGLDTAIWDITL